MINLTNLTTFPSKPENEVPRDNLVVQIASTFNANCQKQVVIGESLTGKTNLLAQFARHYPDRCISYFITDDPWTQRPYNFIYAMCNQLCALLEEPLPPTTIDLNGLKSQFTALTTKLNMKARSSKITFFYVIDGLEWVSQGIEEDKIVDNLPRIFPIGPYLLYSCQESKLDSLPRHIKDDRRYEPLAFSQSETQTYLSFVGFSTEEAKEIHQRHRGNPGSLKAVYDAKNGDSQFSLESALQEYDRVIEQQIKSYLSRKPDFVSDALNYLSVCSTGLSTGILAGLLSIDKEELIAALKDSGASIITMRNNNERIDFPNDAARRICSKLANQERSSWFAELLDFVEQNHSDEEFLLTTLYIEAKDYKGLQKQLTSSSIVTTVENPLNGVSGVLQRLRSASQMAIEKQDYEGLLKWSLGISVVKSYIEHTINHDEIEALIAIGESQEALRRAYSLPDPTNRIRFIARIYSTMKAKNERVSKEALEELEGFINSLNVSQLDREIVEKLAIDIFPLLPDVSFALLDTIKIDGDKNGVIELFSKAISGQFKEAANESETDPSEKQTTKFAFSRIFADWLEDKPLSELEKVMTHLKTTKAKEQLARQWCKQNSGSPDLAKGIFLWLEIVKSDYDFVITLKSLQQISSLLRDVPVQIRVDLIRDLNVPRITALDSPKQEWIRFNLNLAEGLAEIDAQESLNKILHLYEQVLEDSLDLDIETFCLARILSTISRIFPGQKTMRDMVERKFNTTFYSLLEDSAEQYDSLHETLGAFVEIDLDCALVMASELNISQRREWAKAHIFRVALLRKGSENISKPECVNRNETPKWIN